MVTINSATNCNFEEILGATYNLLAYKIYKFDRIDKNADIQLTLDSKGKQITKMYLS